MSWHSFLDNRLHIQELLRIPETSLDSSELLALTCRPKFVELFIRNNQAIEIPQRWRIRGYKDTILMFSFCEVTGLTVGNFDQSDCPVSCSFVRDGARKLLEIRTQSRASTETIATFQFDKVFLKPMSDPIEIERYFGSNSLLLSELTDQT